MNLAASAAEGSVRIVHCVREPPIPLAVRPELLRRETQRVRSVLGHLARGAGLKSRAVRLAGSTTERLLHEAPCDVLLVKPSSSLRR